MGAACSNCGKPIIDELIGIELEGEDRWVCRECFNEEVNNRAYLMNIEYRYKKALNDVLAVEPLTASLQSYFDAYIKMHTIARKALEEIKGA